VECQTQRSQIQNRIVAMENLRARLYQLELDKQHSQTKSTRKLQVNKVNNISLVDFCYFLRTGVFECAIRENSNLQLSAGSSHGSQDQLHHTQHRGIYARVAAPRRPFGTFRRRIAQRKTRRIARSYRPIMTSFERLADVDLNKIFQTLMIALIWKI